MSWYDYTPIGAAYKHFYGDPAKQQKAGYQTAGDSAAALGTDERNYENQQGQQALGYFSGAQAPTGARPTAAGQPGTSTAGQNIHIAGVTPAAQKTALAGQQTALTQQQAAWDKQQAAYQAQQNGTGPISPDQALMNLTQNRPTQQQNYFDFMKGQVGNQTTGEGNYASLKDASGKLTNEETLYNERKDGSDPAAAYQDQRATEGINKQLAARGRFNSGPGVRQVSDYLANANAQRSQQLASLAGGADSSRATINSGLTSAAGEADSSRLGMNNAYGNAATGASGEESGYFSGVMSASQKLAQAKADTFGHYSDRGDDAYMEGQKAKYQAQLQKSGVDAATAKQQTDDFFKGAGAYEKSQGGGG